MCGRLHGSGRNFTRAGPKSIPFTDRPGGLHQPRVSRRPEVWPPSPARRHWPRAMAPPSESLGPGGGRGLRRARGGYVLGAKTGDVTHGLDGAGHHTPGRPRRAPRPRQLRRCPRVRAGAPLPVPRAPRGAGARGRVPSGPPDSAAGALPTRPFWEPISDKR
eukprot:scaffold993_cov393-Prasinococcus_capsulatus_cf.AAC.21